MQQSVHARIVLAWTLLGLRLEHGEKSDVRLRDKMALDEKLQIPHVSCSLSLRHLDRFLLILITIITLHPLCLPFARTHSVKLSVNIAAQ